MRLTQFSSRQWKWIAYRVHVRRHNFVTSALPPSSIMVLIYALNVQLDWNEPQRRHTIIADGILHWICWVVHVAVRIHVIKALLAIVSTIGQPNRKRGAHVAI